MSDLRYCYKCGAISCCAVPGRGEFQLTSVLDRMLREDDGMLGCVIHGNALDMGIPGPYVATMGAFAEPQSP